jgi:hypothetical protein
MADSACVFQCSKNTSKNYNYHPCIYTAGGNITCDNNKYPWTNQVSVQSKQYEQKILEPGSDSNKYTKFILSDMF